MLECAEEERVLREHQAMQFRIKGGYTARYHGLVMLKPDLVGGHTFNMTAMLRFMAADLPPARRCLLLEAALDHDVAECIVGDMPAPTKRAIPGLRESFAVYEAEVMAKHGIDNAEALLTPGELILLKAADALDGMRYCIMERRLGNTLVVSTYEAFDSYVVALNLEDQHRGQNWQPYERAHRLHATLVTEWELHNGR